MTEKMNAQNINILWFDATVTYTPKSGVSVIINPTDTFAINNVFTLELSDANGLWTNPQQIKTANEFYTPVINAELPASLLDGRYKMRIRSSSPEWIEETPSFNVKSGIAPLIPRINSILPNNSVYFNCLNNAAPSFGSLSQDEKSKTSSLTLSQRTLSIVGYVESDTYTATLVDINNNNQIPLTLTSGTFELPDNLPIGTYVIQLLHNSLGVTSIQSSIFLFHGNGTSLGNSSSEEICMGNQVDFKIDNTTASIGRNYKGTKYKINFGDATPTIEFTQTQLMNDPTIEHVFGKPSCSELGSSFIVKLQQYNKGILNSCDVYVKNGNGVTKAVNVSSPPLADFKAPAKSCINKSIFFENITIPGYYGTSGCKEASYFYWYYKKPGTKNFVPVTDLKWIDTKNNLTIPASAITVAGCWEVRIEAQNQDLCQAVSINEKSVMVEPISVVSFIASADSICTDNTVSFKNTSNVLNQSCSAPVFSWIVEPVNGADINGYSFITNLNDAVIKFTKPGQYAVKLKVVNACGTVISDPKNIFVAGGASVSIPTDSLAVCIPKNGVYTVDFSNKSIQPIYNSNYGKIGQYKWTITGANVSSTDYKFVNNTSNVSTFPVIEFNAAKSFKIEVAIVSDCQQSAIASLQLTVNEIPELNITEKQQTICSGTSFSSIALGTTLQTATYKWSISKTPNLITSAKNGSGNLIDAETITNTSDSIGTLVYHIIPTSGLCEGNEFSYTIYVKPLLKAKLVSNKDFCLGAADAVVKLVCQNGNGPYSINYSISNQPVQQISSQAGNDTISIHVSTIKTGKQVFKLLNITDSDINTCDNQNPDSITVEIVDNPLITTQPLANQTVCKGAIIDPLTVICAGGTGMQKVQWFKNTENKNYGGTPIIGANSLSYQPTAFQDIAHSYYYCTITMNGSNCGSATSETAHIEVVSDPLITSYENNNQSVCKNSLLNALQIRAQGGSGSYLYQWYASNDTTKGNWTKITDANKQAFTPPSSEAGIKYYYCEVKQNNIGCEVLSYAFKVEVFENPTITKQPLSQQICKNETAPVLTVDYSGGNKNVSYQWFKANEKSNIGGIAIDGATEKNLTISTSQAGIFYYYCQLTFGTTGCGIVKSNAAEINVTQFPIIDAKSIEIISGQRFNFTPEASNLEIIPTGTTYTWLLPQVSANSPLSGMSAQSTPQKSISDIIFNHSDTISSVRYTVTPQNNSCIGASFNVNVIVLPALTALVKKQNISCFGDNNGQLETTIYGGIRFKSGSPYIVNWSGPNGFTSSNLRLTNLSQGEYTLTVRDSVGAICSNKYIIEQPEKLIITTDKFISTSCSGENQASIDVKVSGGKGRYSYQWTKNGEAFSTKEDISNLDHGNYILTVIDENACSAVSEKFEISNFEPIIIDVLEQINNNCYNGTNGVIKVNVKGGTKIQLSSTEVGYNYNWTGPNNFKSTSRDIENLISGEYQLIVSDKTDCSAILKVFISQATEIIVTSTTTPVSCFGKNDATISLQVSGGTAPYSVEWSNYATGLSLDNVSPGIYTAKVIDANKCEKSIVVKIDDETKFTVYPVVNQITCNGANNGSIRLTIKSNRQSLKVKWLDGSNAGNERNNLAPGIYTVEISDGGPCVITNSFVISEPAKLNISSKIKNSFGCEQLNSGAIDIEVIGGTKPYNYTWSTGAKTQDIQSLLPGKYFVTISDSLGCEASAVYELLRHEALKIEVSTKAAYCNVNLKYKQICTAAVSGGLAPYTYKWSSGEVNASDNTIMESFTNQTVALEVTDALGCSSTFYFKTEIAQSLIETQVLDCNNQVYKFNIQTPPTVFTNLKFKWNFGDGTSSDIKNPTHTYLKAGNYDVKLKITSAEGELNFETVLAVEALPTLKLDREPRFCKNDSVEIIVTGAQTYLWNDGTKGNRKMIKREGNYTVIGTTANGCTNTLNFSAKHYDNQNYTINTDKVVLTLNDPTLKVWSEEVNLTSYKWDFNDGTKEEGNYVNHTYDIDSPQTLKIKLDVVNPNGCQEIAEKTVWLIMESLPNTFTPNNDGTNDRFLKGSKIQIFNSNGVILYEGSEGWDGTYKGKQVGMDTYYYVVYYSTPEGIVNKAGFVFLAK